MIRTFEILDSHAIISIVCRLLPTQRTGSVCFIYVSGYWDFTVDFVGYHTPFVTVMGVFLYWTRRLFHSASQQNDVLVGSLPSAHLSLAFDYLSIPLGQCQIDRLQVTGTDVRRIGSMISEKKRRNVLVNFT